LRSTCDAITVALGAFIGSGALYVAVSEYRERRRDKRQVEGLGTLRKLSSRLRMNFAGSR
jgi:hypothetical protein